MVKSSFWLPVPLTKHFKRDNASHGEVTINNAATVPDNIHVIVVLYMVTNESIVNQRVYIRNVSKQFCDSSSFSLTVTVWHYILFLKAVK